MRFFSFVWFSHSFCEILLIFLVMIVICLICSPVFIDVWCSVRKKKKITKKKRVQNCERCTKFELFLIWVFFFWFLLCECVLQLEQKWRQQFCVCGDINFVDLSFSFLCLCVCGGMCVYFGASKYELQIVSLLTYWSLISRKKMCPKMRCCCCFCYKYYLDMI